MTTLPAPSFPPIGLSREEAARHIGVGATTFDAMVEKGEMPQPIRIGRRCVWDREEVEACFRRLKTQAADETADEWAA
jgi:excisionase family DNA binding protein